MVNAKKCQQWAIICRRTGTTTLYVPNAQPTQRDDLVKLFRGSLNGLKEFSESDALFYGAIMPIRRI